MKVRLLHLIVRAALGIERLFSYIFGSLGQRVHQGFSSIGRGLGYFLPSLFLLLYRLGKGVGSVVGGVMNPAEKRFFAITAHRYTIHVLAVVILLFTAWSSIDAETDQGIFSPDDAPLSVIAGTQEETYVEVGFEKRTEDGTPTVFVLDVPDETIQEDLLVALDGAAVWAVPAPAYGAATRTAPEDYIVREGDTASSIAEQFGVSVGTILWENKLGPYDILRPGRKLVVLPISGVSYTVGRGETLEQIAKKFSVEIERISEYNEATLLGKKLAQGATLVIPGGRPYVAPRPVVVAPTRLTTRTAVPKPASALPAAPEAGTRLLWPTVSHHINQYFSWRHTGLDIHGRLDSPIYASDDGVAVVVEYKRTGYGQSIVIDHGNGIRTRYGHASQIFIVQGEAVKRGQIIAMVGSTGRSTGPHLHYEVLVAGKRVNPFGYTR